MHVLVTGAAGALGSGLAKLLLARGHVVSLVDRAAAAQRLSALTNDLGESARAFPLSDTSDMGAVARQSEAVLGPIAGAALIAGGWAGGRRLADEVDGATLGSMIESNLTTAHSALRALLPGMVSRKAGSIVVVGSRAAVRPETSAMASSYAASKAALLAMASVAAAEVLDAGVRVNAVLPSTIDTKANRLAMPNADASKWVSVDSLSAVIHFLLSDDSRDVSGAAIPVYGRS